MIIQKLKALPQGAKASISFFLASIVTKGISYLVMPIYTRILPVEVFGQTSIFMTWLEIFGIFAMFCLSYGVFNNGMLENPNNRDEYSFSMLILSNIITVTFTIGLVAIYPYVKDYVGIDLPLILLMCVVFMFQPAFNFWSTRQRYELKYKSMVFWSILSAIASPVLAVLCILTTEVGKLHARIFGAEFPLIVMYVGFYIYLAIKSRFKVETKFWKEAVRFNLPLIPHYLSIYLLGNAIKLMVSNIAGDEAAAYYSVASSVASITLVVWTAINSSLVPYTYEKCQKKEYKAVSDVAIPILMVFGTMCIMVSLLAPEVVAVMTTSEYAESIYAIPPIVGGVFFQVQYFLYANIVYYYKKPKYVMYASITAVVINFLLGSFLIKQFGYLAAGYSTLICYLVQAILDYLAMKKVVKEEVYNMKQVGLISMIVLLTSTLSGLLYSNVYVRYGLFLLLGAILLLFGRKILAVVKKTKGVDV